MFLGCQALEWRHLFSEGFGWGHTLLESLGKFFHEGVPRLQDNMTAQQFANLFFTITGFHGFHVFTGVIINIIITD
jgi:cytochrome c oxidase subunit 3